MIVTDDVSDVFLTAVGVLAVFYIYSSKSKQKKLPPGPIGVPVLGYLPFVGVNTTDTFMRLGKIYGPIFSIKMGDQNWVVLNSYEAIHEALVKNGDAFSGRPHVHMYYKFTKGKGIGISEGPFWKVQRKFGVQTLKKFGFGSGGMEVLLNREIGCLLDELSNRCDKAFDPHCLISNAVSNVICQMTMGHRYQYNDTNFNDLLLRMNEGFGEKLDGKLFHIMVIASFTRFLPIFWGVYNRFMKARYELLDHIQAIIEDHKKTYDPNYMRDFIDEFLKEMKAREGTKSTFDDEQLLLYVMDLFVAGSETTSTSFRWFLLALITFPEVQEKLYREIAEVVGDGRPVSLKDQGRMPYTNSFILESLRHRCILPIFLPHKTLHSVEFRGYHIPKGTSIIPHIWSSHFDPRYFDKPNEFRPDRFVDAAGNFVPDPHVVPYSFGPRYCLGEKLARAELFLMLTNLLQRFQVTTDPAHPIPDFYDGVFGGVHAPHRFHCVFKQRG